jgi:hypothetical protein
VCCVFACVFLFAALLECEAGEQNIRLSLCALLSHTIQVPLYPDVCSYAQHARALTYPRAHWKESVVMSRADVTET